MTVDDQDATVAATVPAPQALTITVGGETYTAEPRDAPITIGREFPAHIQIPDQRISRTHLRLRPEGGHWVASDHSTNGTFVNGTRQASVRLTDGIILHLGNAEGIEVAFALTTTAAAPDESAAAVDGDQTEDEDGDVTNPAIARVGAAVAARRRELNIAQRALAKDKIMNAGALISFEKGRSWPHRSTLAKLERVLQWEPGTIARIRWEAEGKPADADGDPEQTVVLTNTVEAPLMVAAVDVALGTIRTQIDTLPAPTDSGFSQRATPILNDLRKLEQVAMNAARSTKGAADVALILSAVRRAYRDLMMRAARSPEATFGQRLFAARQRAELSVEEAANAAGVPAETLTAAEADLPVGDEASVAVRALLGSLSSR